jgi:hypothetical protein
MRPSFSDRPIQRLVVGLAFLGAASAGIGCGAACDTSDDANSPERYRGGQATATGYESSSWKAGLLPFPGGKQYQLEHHLGFTPSLVEVYIGFGPDGERVSLCAGNSCLVRCVDDQLIWIKNDTCADFWVRVATTGRSFENRGTACTGGSFEAGPGNDGGTEDADGSAPGDASASEVGSSVDASDSTPIEASTD